MEDHAEQIRGAVRAYYAERALTSTSCCEEGSTCAEPEMIPESALTEETFTLGCGDAITPARLQAGETVLDLGSGGGLDCILAAERVGSSGRVIGVDMTPEMIARAQESVARIGLTNVSFRQGLIEELPVEDESIDVVISNCVINLLPDKEAAFREVHRVLKPGGRLSISDIVTHARPPEADPARMDRWCACESGAIPVREYEQALRRAGLTDIRAFLHLPEGRSLDDVPEDAPLSATFTATRPGSG